MSRRITTALLAGIATAALSPGLAAAQDTSQDQATAAATPSAAAETPNDTGDVVVTAQRRAENNLNVPIALSVIRPEALRDYQASGGDTLLTLSGRVPGLYVESSTGRIFPRFYIRGLGNIDFYLGASQPVEVLMDDVVEEHVVLKSNPAFDIADVEVLKGPQGTLFGRNTTAGIVKFDTAQPTETWAGQGSVSYGRFNSVNADAGVGGPLTKDGRISFRLSGLFQHRDNWVSNVYTGPSDDGTVGGRNKLNGFDERDVRLQVLAKPTDNLSFKVSGHYRDYDGFASLFYRGSIQRGTNAVPANLDRSIVSYDEGQNNPQGYKTHGVSLKAAYDFGAATLTSITAWEHASGYSRGDTDGGAAVNFPLNGAPFGFGESQGRLRYLDQWTEEVRLASPDTGRFKWQLGGIYFDQRDNTEFDQRTFFLTSNVFGGAGNAPNPNNFVLLHDHNFSYAGFGQASYKLTDRLTLTGGVRVTYDVKTTNLLQRPNYPNGLSRPPATAPSSAYRCNNADYCRLSDTQPSWEGALLYRLSDEASVYARVSRGFRGPTIQGRSAVFGSSYSTADSETNTSYEGGVKTAFWDGRIRFNAAGFYYVVDNIQLNGNDANGNGVLFNANKGRGYGIEADVDAHPVPNLRITAGLSLLHTRIDDKTVYAQVGAANGVLSETVLNPTVRIGNNYFAQIDGNAFPNAPDYNVNVSARYDLPLGGDSRIFLGGDFNMQGKTNFTLYRTVEYNADGNYELGAKLGYAFGRYEAAVFARNITNTKNLVNVIDTNNYRAGIYNEPRVFGVSLSGSFR